MVSAYESGKSDVPPTPEEVIDHLALTLATDPDYVARVKLMPGMEGPTIDNLVKRGEQILNGETPEALKRNT